MIQLVVLDEHTFFRLGVKQIFECNSEICVVGEASYDAALFGILAQSTADVVLLEINIPDDLSYIEVARHI